MYLNNTYVGHFLSSYRHIRKELGVKSDQQKERTLKIRGLACKAIGTFLVVVAAISLKRSIQPLSVGTLPLAIGGIFFLIMGMDCVIVGDNLTQFDVAAFQTLAPQIKVLPTSSRLVEPLSYARPNVVSFASSATEGMKIRIAPHSPFRNKIIERTWIINGFFIWIESGIIASILCFILSSSK